MTARISTRDMRGSVRSDQGWKHITLLWRRQPPLGLRGIPGDPHGPAGRNVTGYRDKTPEVEQVCT